MKGTTNKLSLKLLSEHYTLYLVPLPDEDDYAEGLADFLRLNIAGKGLSVPTQWYLVKKDYLVEVFHWNGDWLKNSYVCTYVKRNEELEAFSRLNEELQVNGIFRLHIET